MERFNSRFDQIKKAGHPNGVGILNASARVEGENSGDLKLKEVYKQDEKQIQKFMKSSLPIYKSVLKDINFFQIQNVFSNIDSGQPYVFNFDKFDKIELGK